MGLRLTEIRTKTGTAAERLSGKGVAGDLTSTLLVVDTTGVRLVGEEGTVTAGAGAAAVGTAAATILAGVEEWRGRVGDAKIK